MLLGVAINTCFPAYKLLSLFRELGLSLSFCAKLQNSLKKEQVENVLNLSTFEIEKIFQNTGSLL